MYSAVLCRSHVCVLCQVCWCWPLTRTICRGRGCSSQAYRWAPTGPLSGGGGVIVAALSVYFTCMHLWERERERCVFVCVTEGDRKCAWKSMCSRTRRCGKWCRAVDVFLASQGAAGSMASMLFQVFLCVRQTRAARKNGPRYMIWEIKACRGTVGTAWEELNVLLFSFGSCDTSHGHSCMWSTPRWITFSATMLLFAAMK